MRQTICEKTTANRIIGFIFLKLLPVALTVRRVLVLSRTVNENNASTVSFTGKIGFG